MLLRKKVYEDTPCRRMLFDLLIGRRILRTLRAHVQRQGATKQPTIFRELRRFPLEAVLERSYLNSARQLHENT